MVKKEIEIFDVPENEVVAETPKKTKKVRKPLDDDEKAALVKRLKEGRERKKREREGKKNVKERPPTPTPTPVAPVAPVAPVVSDTSNLAEEIKELRKQIRETKEKQEIADLKAELNELQKKSNNNVSQDVIPEKKVAFAPSPSKPKPLSENPSTKNHIVPSDPKPAPVPPSQPVEPPKPKVLKKRVR
tara:strand:- start:920 stop:1483 length:564 start_codon:yes stop_codon:yes gene_type:complete